MPQGADPKATEVELEAAERWGRDLIVLIAVVVYAICLPVAGFLVDIALGFLALAVAGASVALFFALGVDQPEMWDAFDVEID